MELASHGMGLTSLCGAFCVSGMYLYMLSFVIVSNKTGAYYIISTKIIKTLANY